MPWFCKKITLILEKPALFECVYRLDSYFKFNFKGILQKNTKIFPVGLLFCIPTWNVYWSVLIPRNLPEIFLFACLIFVPIKQVKLYSSYCFVDIFFWKKVVHGKVEGLIVKVMIHNQEFHKKFLSNALCAFLFNSLYSQSKDLIL